MHPNKPLLSIIIVNFNSKKHTENLLVDLNKQELTNQIEIEILVIDNNSSDNSHFYLNNKFKKKNYHFYKLKKNYGFGYANSFGISKAVGNLILLINNDTRIGNSFISNLYLEYSNSNVDIISPYESHDPEAGNNSTLKNKKKKINQIDIFGHPIVFKGTSRSPFYLPGSCIFFSKKLYIETGGFDHNIFMYVEEVDWFWRLHLYKKKIKNSSSVCYYHIGAQSNEEKTLLKKNTFLWRNQHTLYVLLKNYHWLTLALVLPLYFLQNFIEIIFFSFTLHFRIAFTYVQGWIFNIKKIPTIYKKRKEIQSKREVSDIHLIKTKMYLGLAKWVHLLQLYKHEKN